MRRLFFELLEMKDKKYPNEVWIDLISYCENIWLEGPRSKDDAILL